MESMDRNTPQPGAVIQRATSRFPTPGLGSGLVGLAAASLPLLNIFCSSFRAGSDGRFDGPTHGRIIRREALKTRPATRRRAKRRRAKKRMTVMRTTRWNEAEGGGIVTESDEAPTPPHPQMRTYLQMMTPANTVVSLTTLSWWVFLLWTRAELSSSGDCPSSDYLLSLQILLCDWCDSGYHTACLRPPLMIIPDGEWFCPPCQHVRPTSASSVSTTGRNHHRFSFYRSSCVTNYKSSCRTWTLL